MVVYCNLLGSPCITANKLEVPVMRKQVTDLIAPMSNGSVYTNTHTEQNPMYSIRGQIMCESDGS